MAGTHPGDAGSKPQDQSQPPSEPNCEELNQKSDWNVCGYDPQYVFLKLHRDFCGQTPSFEDIESFKSLSSDQQINALHSSLDNCLDSEFWLGKEGVLWRMGHIKIKPARSIKSGTDGGDTPLGDYYDDYNLFVYHMIDNHDVRGLLTANYFVLRTDNPTTYTQSDNVPLDPENPGLPAAVSVVMGGGQQFVPPEQRAGMMTTLWNMVTGTMFTSIPRANAAEMLRKYLNIDFAKGERLNEFYPKDEFVLIDYDNKGVEAPDCAFCHRALDPVSYPFTQYNGLSSGALLPRSENFLLPGIFKENRIDILAEQNSGIEPDLANTPTEGFLFGQPVANLVEWAQVAANSDDFAKTVVLDFFKLLKGREPNKDELTAYDQLWQDLKGKHNYGVEAMLHDFIKTEVYGAP